MLTEKETSKPHAANWVPSFNVLKAVLGITEAPFPERLSISATVLTQLLKGAIASAPFNETDYLDANPDLKAAWDAGAIRNLHEHYIEAGYFEGRSASKNEVDADWYAGYYGDVGGAINQGIVKSSEDHYLKTGMKEWRAPNEAVLKHVVAWRRAVIDV